MLYANDIDNARILIINKVVTNEQDAMKNFLKQIKICNSQNKKIKNNILYIRDIKL